MNNKSEKIINKAKSVNLTADEKTSIREVIIYGMNLRPIPSPFAKIFFFSKKYSFSMAIILITLLGTGASAIAKGALPGDLFYPVKINFNEKVESVLAITPKASALIQVEQATRRIEEAESLAIKGELTAKINTEIKNRFSKKVEAIDKSFKQMEKEGDTEFVSEVSNKFEKDLDHHFKTFIDVSVGSSTKNDTSTTTLSNIVRRVKSKHYQNFDNISSSTPNIEKIKNRQQKEDKNKNEIERGKNKKSDDNENGD